MSLIAQIVKRIASSAGPDSGYFAIDSTTGELTMAQNLDRDAGKSEVSLTLTVTDQTGLVATKDFTILLVDINDLPPVFNPIEYSVEVIENTPPGTFLSIILDLSIVFSIFFILLRDILRVLVILEDSLQNTFKKTCCLKFCFWEYNS